VLIDPVSGVPPLSRFPPTVSSRTSLWDIQLQTVYVNIALTEPSLSDLLRRKGKHREQLDHYLHYHIRHYRSEWDVGIDVQALDEAPQMLKEIREGIIT
jgi:hypothetical protein